MSIVEPLVIHQGSVADAFAVYEAIPEFAPTNRITRDEFATRLADQSRLVLLARCDDVPVAFKAGYDRYRDGSWYSWLGGVLPSHRGLRLAQRLIETQESWVREHGYRRLFVKTRNRFHAMRALLARSGYLIVSVEAPDDGADLADLRLMLVKEL
jgi:GNAT superfamily N-acetyltransferase